MNEYFQSEKSVVAFVHERMVNAYIEILLSFMRRDYVCLTPVNDICPIDESKWLPLEQIYLGVGVMNQLLLPALRNKKEVIVDLKKKCLSFLSTMCVQLKKRYDFADPVLQRLNLLSPEKALSQKEREKTPSLHTLASLLPRIINPNDTEKFQVLDDQWRILPYQIQNLPKEIKETKDPEEFWDMMYRFENEIGKKPFSILALFALETLSIPISNADCERKFSKINDIKTKKRNRLLTKTVCGLLHADSAVRYKGNCCVTFKPDKTIYEKMTAENIYKHKNTLLTESETEEIENVFAGCET